jgi:hypothetical protein
LRFCIKMYLCSKWHFKKMPVSQQQNVLLQPSSLEHTICCIGVRSFLSSSADSIRFVPHNSLSSTMKFANRRWLYSTKQSPNLFVTLSHSTALPCFAMSALIYTLYFRRSRDTALTPVRSCKDNKCIWYWPGIELVVGVKVKVSSIRNDFVKILSAMTETKTEITRPKKLGADRKHKHIFTKYQLRMQNRKRNVAESRV